MMVMGCFYVMPILKIQQQNLNFAIGFKQTITEHNNLKKYE